VALQSFVPMTIHTIATIEHFYTSFL